VIVAIDGKPVRNMFDLTTLLDVKSAGETVELQALRGGDQSKAAERVTVKAVLDAEQQ
jgi:S1-C subfamily serine protease